MKWHTRAFFALAACSSPTADHHAQITIEQPGFIYIFVYNRSNAANWVFFDEMLVTHQHSPIVAGADYYPFGLVMDGREITDEAYRYGYQGQYAEEDETTGWNEFEARDYDSRFGRWTSSDPAYQFASPYLGMGNSPTNSVDTDGEYVYIIGKGYRKKFKQIIDFLYNTHYGQQLLDKYGMDVSHDIYIKAGRGRRISDTEESGAGTLNVNNDFVSQYTNAQGRLDLSLFKKRISFKQFQVFNGTDVSLSKATESVSFIYFNSKVFNDASIHGAEALGHEIGAHLKKVPNGFVDLQAFNNGQIDHSNFGSDRALIKTNLSINAMTQAGQMAYELKNVNKVKPGVRIGTTIVANIFSMLLFRRGGGVPVRGGPRYVPLTY